MKLKRFNFFQKKKEIVEENLYKEILNDDEFIENHKFENFTDAEYKKIKSWLDGPRSGSEIIDKYPNAIIFAYKYSNNTLYKFEDEWFLLKCGGKRGMVPQGITKYYLCDTIDGVLQAVKFFEKL